MQPSPAAVRFSFLHRNTPNCPAVKAAFAMLCPWARWAGFCSARNLLAPGFFSPSRYPTGTSLSPASLSVLHPSPRAPHGSARSAGDKAQGDKGCEGPRPLSRAVPRCWHLLCTRAGWSDRVGQNPSSLQGTLLDLHPRGSPLFPSRFSSVLTPRVLSLEKGGRILPQTRCLFPASPRVI